MSGTYVALAHGRWFPGQWWRGFGEAVAAAARAVVHEAERRVRRGRFPVVMTISAAALAGGLAHLRGDVAVVVVVVLARVADRRLGRRRRGLVDAGEAAASAVVHEVGRHAPRGRFPVIMPISAAALAGGL